MTAELEWQIAQLKPGDHLCLLYQTVEEQLAAVVPFMRDGLAAGERCLYVADDRTVDEVRAALGAAGVEVAREIARGALAVITKREAYLRSGAFDPAAMIGLLRDALGDAIAAGFQGLRVTGEMTWALGPEAGTDRLVEYEARLNEFFPGSRALAICQYNRSRFPPAIIREVLRTHPIAILGDQVCPNLYYEPPSAVLGSPSETERVRWMISQLRDARQRDQNLRLSEAKFSAIISAASEAIVSVDARQHITLFNAGAEHTFGYAAAEVLGQSHDVLLPERFRAGHRQAMQRLGWLPRPARPMTRSEITGRRKNGKEFPAEACLSCWDKGGEITYTAIIRDLTERKSLEAQLRQAQKMEAVGRLAGGVAHDFNNLLTVILAEADLAVGELPHDHPVRSSVEEIRTAAARATGLTRQLLVFSRRQIVEPTVFSPNDLVADMDKMLRRLVGEDIAFDVRQASAIGRVKADRGQIEQVIMNLVVNARDAMPDGGHLVLETANVTLDEAYARSHAEVRGGEYVMVAVSDTGVGMSDEVKSHLFEPFFTTKQDSRGTGLGLATSYGIVKQAGGHIDAYSESGVGTTVKVYLPCAKEPLSAAKQPQDVALLRGTETLLLVEDEAKVRQAASRMLRAQGYTVVEAAHGAEALRLLEAESRPIHLLITDVVLPGINGRVLAEHVREARPHIRVLFISGYTNDVVLRQKLLERGAMLLHKPFTADALAAKVRGVLDAPSA